MDTVTSARGATPAAPEGDELHEHPVPISHPVSTQVNRANQTPGAPVVATSARPVPAISVPADPSADADAPPPPKRVFAVNAGTGRTAAEHAPPATDGSEVPEQLPVAEGPGGYDKGFAPGVAAKLRSYVYLLLDPRTGRAFCVGRGRGDRCFRHVRAARLTSDRAAEAGQRPKYPMLERIREVESDGRSVRIDILRHGLSAAEALLVEAAAGEALGLEIDPELGSQRHPTTDTSSLLAKRAKFKRGHQVVLLRAGGSGGDPSYEPARHGWRIGRRWTDLDSPRSPRWAVIVVGDLVAAVYRIQRWEPTGGSGGTADTSHGAGRPADRHSFVGTRDAELERRYAGKSVAAHWGAGSQSPVTYVWCGPHWVNTAH